MLRADQASFAPPNNHLDLQGNVKVTAASGTCLTANEASWLVIDGKLLINGPYTLGSSKRKSKGCNAQFSLVGGEFRRTKPFLKPASPGETELPGFPVNLMIKALNENKIPGGQNLLLPLMAMMQSQAGGTNQ